MSSFLKKKLVQDGKSKSSINENGDLHFENSKNSCGEVCIKLEDKPNKKNLRNLDLEIFKENIKDLDCNPSSTTFNDKNNSTTQNNTFNSGGIFPNCDLTNNNNINKDNNDKLNSDNSQISSPPEQSGEEFVCLHCSQTFPHEGEYACHMRSVHKQNIALIPCHLCKKKFKIETCYRKHMHLHANDGVATLQEPLKNLSATSSQHLTLHAISSQHLTLHATSSQQSIPHATIVPIKTEHVSMVQVSSSRNNTGTTVKIYKEQPSATTALQVTTHSAIPSIIYSAPKLTHLSAKFDCKTLPNSNVDKIFSVTTGRSLHWSDNNTFAAVATTATNTNTTTTTTTNNNNTISINNLKDDGNGERGVEGVQEKGVLVEGVNVVDNVKGKKVVVYYCQKCDKSYNRQLLYDEHLRVHAGLKPFCCEICGRMFARESNLAGHRQSHKQSKVYRCKVCKVKFSIKQKLVLHEMVHDLEEPFKCHLCIARFVREADYQEHLKTHPEYAETDAGQLVSQPTIEEIILDQNIVSDSMNAQVIYSNVPETAYHHDGLLSNTISYLSHIATEQHPCPDNNIVNNNNNINSNNSINNLNEEFPLNVISDVASSAMEASFNATAAFPTTSPVSCTETGDVQAARRHKDIKQEVQSDDEEDKQTPLDEAPTIAKNGECINDVTHYLTPSGKVRPYIFCEVCGQPYKLMREYQDHMRRHTGHKPYCCEVCGKTFHRSKNLSAHRYSHVEVKRHKCDVCGKCFPLSTRLKIHQRIHTGEKPYECELCHQRFIRRNDYMDHRRKHTGGNTCVHCNKKYSKLETLREHINDKHNKVKPIKCKLCDERFSYSVALYRHMKKHRGQEKDLNKKVHSCSYCPKSFTRPCLLNRHVLKTHPQHAHPSQ